MLANDCVVYFVILINWRNIARLQCMEYVYFYSVACYITKVFFQKKHKQYKKPVFFFSVTSSVLCLWNQCMYMKNTCMSQNAKVRQLSTDKGCSQILGMCSKQIWHVRVRKQFNITDSAANYRNQLMGFIFDYYSTFAYKLAQKMKNLTLCADKKIYTIFSVQVHLGKKVTNNEKLGGQKGVILLVKKC